MFKFLIKLAIVAVVGYLLLQIPFVSKYGDQLKADIMQKVNNVTAEVDRVKGKIDETGQKIDDIKKTGENIVNTVSETGKTIEKGIETINKTTEALKGALNGTPETTSPASTTPTPELVK